MKSFLQIERLLSKILLVWQALSNSDYAVFKIKWKIEQLEPLFMILKNQQHVL